MNQQAQFLQRQLELKQHEITMLVTSHKGMAQQVDKTVALLTMLLQQLGPQHIDAGNQSPDIAEQRVEVSREDDGRLLVKLVQSEKAEQPEAQ